MINQYFSIKMDERVQKGIPFNQVNPKNFQSNQPILLEISTEKKSVSVDYIRIKQLFKYFYILSDALKEVFEMYQEDMIFQPIILNDKQAETQKLYWRAEIEVLEYRDLNGTENKIKNNSIFIVRNKLLEELVIHFSVAESMLRRYLLGIQYEPFKLK